MTFAVASCFDSLSRRQMRRKEFTLLEVAMYFDVNPRTLAAAIKRTLFSPLCSVAETFMRPYLRKVNSGTELHGGWDSTTRKTVCHPHSIMNPTE